MKKIIALALTLVMVFALFAVGGGTAFADDEGKVFNIYIAAILVRPFSREAYEQYCQTHESIDDINQRLMLMFDSREFDRIHGYDQSYGSYKNQEEADAVMYRVVNKESDILELKLGNRILIVEINFELRYKKEFPTYKEVLTKRINSDA